MIIPDTVRQEDMPQMVYILCKLASLNNYSKDQIRKLMTSSNQKEYDDDNGKERFDHVFNFAKSAGMISEEHESITSNFKNGEVESFYKFTLALLKKMELQKNGKFDTMLKWLLLQDSDIENIKKTSDIKIRMDQDKTLQVLNIQEDLLHGFEFWCEAFQIINFADNKRGRIFFCLEDLLLGVLNNNIFDKKGLMPVHEFFRELEEYIYFMPYTYSFDDKRIYYPLSRAIRVLELSNKISLNTVQDSEQTWHLYPSEIYRAGNNFTHIKVN